MDKIKWDSPPEPDLSILECMQAEAINQMPVLDDRHVVGMISRDSILRVFQSRLKLGDLAEQYAGPFYGCCFVVPRARTVYKSRVSGAEDAIE
jgi:hypothetical protein